MDARTITVAKLHQICRCIACIKKFIQSWRFEEVAQVGVCLSNNSELVAI